MTVSFPPFQFGCFLFYFLFWLLWLGLSILCWIGVVREGILGLVPDLRGKALRFCPLRMMLAVGLSYMAFIMLRYARSLPTLLSVFIINGCCTLSNAFSASIGNINSFNIIPHSFPCLPLLGFQTHSISSNKHLLSTSMCQALFKGQRIKWWKISYQEVCSLVGKT